MDSGRARLVFLRLFVGFLIASAAVAILCVLNGEFGEFEIKVLITTFSISGASICSMSCAAFIEKRRNVSLGGLGILFSSMAALMIIFGAWFEVGWDGYWKTTVTFVVFGVAMAHAFLLRLPDLDWQHQWTQMVSSISIGILSLQIVGALWGEIDEEAYYRMVAVVSIVVVLLTMVIPILMKMRKGEAGEADLLGAADAGGGERLVLVKREDGTYGDEGGGVYRVERVGGEEAGPQDG